MTKGLRLMQRSRVIDLTLPACLKKCTPWFRNSRHVSRIERKAQFQKRAVQHPDATSFGWIVLRVCAIHYIQLHGRIQPRRERKKPLAPSSSTRQKTFNRFIKSPNHYIVHVRYPPWKDEMTCESLSHLTTALPLPTRNLTCVPFCTAALCQLRGIGHGCSFGITFQ